MNIPEAIVCRSYYTKFGERIVSFKCKKEDRTSESDKYFEECWEDGRSLVVATAEFQNENDQSMPEEPKEREKTVYEELRCEVIKGILNGQDRNILWHEFKAKRAAQLGWSEEKELHSKDLWTPEEAEAEILKFKGLQ